MRAPLLLISLAALSLFSQQHRTVTDEMVREVTRSTLLIDTHNDVTSRTVKGFDIGKDAAAFPGREAGLTAHLPCLMEQPGIGDLMDQTEGDQCDRMCVNYAPHFGARLINGLMQRQLRRWRVLTFDGPIGSHQHDIGVAEITLIDARRRDPHVTVGLPDGEIATGSGGHAIAVDPLHRLDDFVGYVHV